jgi:hypothetical protein
MINLDPLGATQNGQNQYNDQLQLGNDSFRQAQFAFLISTIKR